MEILKSPEELALSSQLPDNHCAFHRRHQIPTLHHARHTVVLAALLAAFSFLLALRGSLIRHHHATSGTPRRRQTWFKKPLRRSLTIHLQPSSDPPFSTIPESEIRNSDLFVAYMLAGLYIRSPPRNSHGLEDSSTVLTGNTHGFERPTRP